MSGAAVAVRPPHLTQTQGEQVRAVLALVLEADRILREAENLMVDCRVPGLSYEHLTAGQLGVGLFVAAALQRLNA